MSSYLLFSLSFLLFSLFSSLPFLLLFPRSILPLSLFPVLLVPVPPVPGVDFGSKLLRLFNDPTQRPTVNFLLFSPFLSFIYILHDDLLSWHSPPHLFLFNHLLATLSYFNTPSARYAIFVASQQQQQQQQQRQQHHSSYDSSTTTPFLSLIPTFQLYTPRAFTPPPFFAHSHTNTTEKQNKKQNK
ncbi:hypothetical protein K457DRAFT_300031 [Linnemannia elongata AG-77]|uniref:Uncharacterized protein n=1 Tax=Linnemannia elongata AG-77 TaxID=1314771 RepID=A0A197JBY0_9FUNG|nr:hypothetical protein K457DRAFT_300031 [Linnemannia elongata AG-77]